MPQPPIAGARLIDRQPATIEVTDMRILEPASLQFSRGGCDRPGRALKAELVDVRTGVLMLIPMDISYAEKLHKQLGDILTGQAIMEGV